MHPRICDVIPKWPVLRPRRVQSRRRIAQMRRARSIERSWTYLRHEFHGGARPGSGADRPRPPELKSRLGFKNSISKKLWCTPVVFTWYSPFQVLCPTRNFFSKPFQTCELLSGAGIIRSARTAGFQVSLARAFRRVPVSFKYLQWLQAGQARSVPPYGRHSVFVEGGIPMPQVPSGRQGVASPCRIRLTSTIRSSASS